MPELLQSPNADQIRAELQDLILRDLHGPASGEEEIIDEGYVHDRYILGLVVPRDQSVIPEEEEDLTFTDGNGEEGVAEAPTIRNSTLLPSTMGLTFTIDAFAAAIQIKARWGRYERRDSQELGLELEKPHPVWKRVPVEADSPTIGLVPGRMRRWVPNPGVPHVYSLHAKIALADQEKVFISRANLADYALVNMEIGVLIEDRVIGEQITSLFNDMIVNSVLQEMHRRS